MSTIIPAYAICTKCNASVPVYFIASFSSGPHSPIHTDYYRENYGSQVICYDLSICPNCLFVGTLGEFKEVISDYVKGQPWDQLRELEEKYPPSQRYMMMAERLEREGSSKKDIGDCFLRGAWAERMIETNSVRSSVSIATEKWCLSQALKYFSEALEPGEMTGTADDYYLIGELSRRTDIFDKAIVFFSRAKEKVREEKYLCLFLDDMGANRNAVAQLIREMNNIAPNKPFKVSRKVGSKIVGGLTFEDAEQKKQRLLSMGAKVSIKEDDQLPIFRQTFLNMTTAMEAFVQQKDSSNKMIISEYIVTPEEKDDVNFEHSIFPYRPEEKDDFDFVIGTDFSGKLIAWYTPEPWGRGVTQEICKIESVRCLWFKDLTKLVEYGQEHPFDIVVIDVIFREMGKIQFKPEMIVMVKRLLPKCKVICHSTIFSRAQAIEAFKSGADDLFSIPFNLVELIALVKKNLV